MMRPMRIIRKSFKPYFRNWPLWTLRRFPQPLRTAPTPPRSTLPMGRSSVCCCRRTSDCALRGKRNRYGLQSWKAPTSKREPRSDICCAARLSAAENSLNCTPPRIARCAKTPLMQSARHTLRTRTNLLLCSKSLYKNVMRSLRRTAFPITWNTPQSRTFGWITATRSCSRSAMRYANISCQSICVCSRNSGNVWVLTFCIPTMQRCCSRTAMQSPSPAKLRLRTPPKRCTTV